MMLICEIYGFITFAQCYGAIKYNNHAACPYRVRASLLLAVNCMVSDLLGPV